MIKPFRISVPDAALRDLKQRLAATRWPESLPNEDWHYGTDAVYLHALCDYWRGGFDWRAREADLNAFPQYLVNIDGLDIHFVHARGKGPDPLPLVVTHGWPSSVAEFTRLIPLLTDPAAHGGDIGAGVTNHLGRIGGGHVRAIHVMAAPYDVDQRKPPLSAAERDYADALDAWERDEGAYEHQQRTRPQTLAIGLNDSPAGLAAWIIEKWRAWSDCGGDLESSFSKDELLTNVSIYWFGATIGSSVQMYYDSAHAGLPRPPRIEVPARLFLTKENVNRCPRQWAERSYADLSYGLAARGGHFMAAEQPTLLATDLREWFRRCRS